MPTDVSILSVTGVSVTPEIRITKKERNIKSPKMSPPRKDQIPNQNSTRIINKQDPILPPLLEKYPTGYKQLLNDTHYSNKIEDDFNDYTDN